MTAEQVVAQEMVALDPFVERAGSSRPFACRRRIGSRLAGQSSIGPKEEREYQGAGALQVLQQAHFRLDAVGPAGRPPPKGLADDAAQTGLAADGVADVGNLPPLQMLAVERGRGQPLNARVQLQPTQSVRL